MNKQGRMIVICLGMAMALGVAMLLIYFWQGKNAVRPVDSQRIERQEKIRREVLTHQQKVVSKWRLNEVMETEATRISTEKPAPVQDATQRARPLSLNAM